MAARTPSRTARSTAAPASSQLAPCTLAEAAAAACDLLLAVGSTLAVFPAAGLVPTAARAGAAVVIVNGGPTEMDPLADVIVNGSISECLRAMVEGFTPVGG